MISIQTSIIHDNKSTKLVIPAKAGIHVSQPFEWIPALLCIAIRLGTIRPVPSRWLAGMTNSDLNAVMNYGNLNRYIRFDFLLLKAEEVSP